MNIEKNNTSYSWDYAIVGAGILGLSIAREVIKREPDASIIIFEKESMLGKHGSGRNSGVLHSGIYYPEGSVKAKVCSYGAQQLAEYCDTNGLPIIRLGKVVLPIKKSDDCVLEVLKSRADASGVCTQIIDEKQLREIEPLAKSHSGRALYSPSTSVVDPLAILDKIKCELIGQNVKIKYDSKISSVLPDSNQICLGDTTYKYNFLINAAGQYSDCVAKLFGLDKKYVILPFRGSYLKVKAGASIKLNHLIYPVPDIKLPFLGVHSVQSISGDSYFGPSAMPAFGRENYSWLSGLNVSDAAEIIKSLGLHYYLNKQNFRLHVNEEIRRLWKKNFVCAARMLVPSISSSDLVKSSKVGIRAQLYDKREKELVMDFRVEKIENTVHVLNAISPAFTSAFAMAELIAEDYLNI